MEGNEQLKRPSQLSPERKKILDIYSSKGYEGIDEYFNKSKNLKFYMKMIWNILPYRIKSKIKSIIKN